MCLLATDNEAIAETVSASSVSRWRASLREQASVEAERCSERQYLPVEPSGRQSVRTSACDQVTVGRVGTAPAASLTVSFHDSLHGADSVSVGPLLHHRVRNGLQLKTHKKETNLSHNTQLVTGAGFTAHPDDFPRFDAHSVLLIFCF